MRLDFNTQTATALVSQSEITDEDMLSKDNYRHEVGYNKYNIETIFNTESNSYISSYRGYTPDENPASEIWRTAYLKYIGVRYYRRAPLYNNPYAQKPSDLNYSVPTSFYSWNPTIRITDNNILKDQSDPSNIIYFNSPDILSYYLDTDFGKEWSLFFGWGHGTDISGYNYSSHVLVKNGNYENFATTCAMANANSNVLWNVTPIDYVDYVNASRLTSVTINENSVSIYNPSSVIDVWMNVDGNNVKISAGETVTLPIDLSDEV